MRLTQRSQRILLLFLLLSSLLLTLVIVADWLPFLRGPAPETSEWYWPYQLRPFARWWPPALIAGLFWLAAAWWLSPERSSRKRDLIALSASVLLAFLLQLTLIYADRSELAAELIDRTLSNLASGFFEPAAEIENITEVLRNYPQQMPLFASEHAQTHPPGLIMANWFSIQVLSRLPRLSELIAQMVHPLRCTDLWLLDRPPEFAAALALWSLLPLIAAALCIIPAYGLAAKMLHGRSQRMAALLVAVIPSLTLFAPKSVQIYALIVLLLFWVFQTALARRSPWRFFVAGVLASLLTYLSLGNAVLLPFLILYAVLYQFLITGHQPQAHPPQKRWISFFVQMLLFLAGAITLWLLNWLLWKVPPWNIVQVGLQQHYDLVTKFRRYDWWTIWNLVDLVIFSGWPLFLGFAGGLIIAVKAWRQKHWSTVDLLAISLLLLIVSLDISGSARGEVGRIWLFFIPLLAFPAARFWAEALPGKRNAWLIIGLQLLITISIGLSWRPVRAVVVVTQEPEMPDITPANTLDVAFSEQPFSLVGYTLPSTQVQTGEQLELALFWHASGPAQRPYTVFNHLVNSSGNLVAQKDNWPIEGRWPPTCWRAGDEITDTYLITIPDELPAGPYDLYTGLYDALSGSRVPLQDGGDAFFVSKIEVSAP